jgi:undecaprenyl-diphosphatase
MEGKLEPFRHVTIELIVGFTLAVIMLGVFAKLSNDLLHEQLEQFDMVVGEFIRGFHSEILTQIFIFVTDLGDTYTYIVIVLILLFVLIRYLKQYIESFFLLIAVLGSWGLNELLKGIFQRARPEIEHLVEQGGYSFPSGHAMVSFATYGMIAYIVWKAMKGKNRTAWIVIILTVLLILLIGISRIYLGVHYPSDVVAGFSAGALWLITCVIGLRFTQYNQWKKGE